jgi:hypothetical protein
MQDLFLKEEGHIHIAKYLGTFTVPKPREDQSELEQFLDFIQPRWREVLVKKRPLPNMVVIMLLLRLLMAD